MRSRTIARCLRARAGRSSPLQAGGRGQSPAPSRHRLATTRCSRCSFTAVKLTDEFWAPRIEVNRTATVPVAFEQCERTNRVDLFVRAAQVLRGDAETQRDALVGETLREQFEHFDLARRQGFDPRVVREVHGGGDEKGIRLATGRSCLPQIRRFPDDGQRPVSQQAKPGARHRRSDQDHAQVTQGVPPP